MITRVPGIRVGHVTDAEGMTGCTVVLPPPGTVGSVDTKGGSPGTRETDALRPGTVVPEVHGVLLTGGSAFGLAAATGVVRWLEERGIGFDAGPARVPIVPAAVLFDLGVGDADARPGEGEGYAACEAATDGEVPEGSVGAGTGATFAKLPDPRAGWKGGVGTAAVGEGELILGALVAVNALGTVLGEDGEPLATNRNPDADERIWPGASTTLAVVATNATMTKERAWLLAQAGNEALALVIAPAHTMGDGDTVFALATGPVEATQADIERLAATAMVEAVRRAVRSATALGGVPAIGEAAGEAKRSAGSEGEAP